MAIYVKAIKIGENEDSVKYNYGRSQNNLNGIFMIKKDLSDWTLIHDAEIPVGGLIGKICRYYMKTSVFPQEISFQA